ncbi:3-deoxy-7-phosphoheptulonate synthase [Pseudomonas aeruginosa]
MDDRSCRERGAQGRRAGTGRRPAPGRQPAAGDPRRAHRRAVRQPRSKKPHEQVGEQTCRSIAATWSAAAGPCRAAPGRSQRILKGAMRRRAASCATWAGTPRPGGSGMPRRWTSHEMLLLDYELSCCARDEQRRVYLGSTHWPWIGEAHPVDGAHVALLAGCSTRVAQGRFESAATSCWRSASVSTRAASRGA